jgi:hypothetical protein
MISEREFHHDGDEDFTGNFTASADQDYITLFLYPKGQNYDKETIIKNAARAIVKLFPHNFAEKTKHRTYQTDNGNNIISKPEYSPVKRIPSDHEYQTINRFTMLRLAGGPGSPDTLMTQEPVANGEYSNVMGESKGSGINNLSEEDMNTLTHKIEETLLKEALSNEDSTEWAKNKMEKNKTLLAERKEKEKNDTPNENEGMLILPTNYRLA